MYNWAERECRIACKRENPNYDFDSNDFDYGCSCYKSALKAYNSLMEDEHSVTSFGFTKNILIRLMEGQPLTPITDEDFFGVDWGTENHPLSSNEWLKEQGLKSDLQCPRMPSLFRSETLDGKVTYRDVDRDYYVDIEEPSEIYGSWSGFLDEMFPITMPYMPKRDKYQIYAQTFLTDEKHGDFDTKGILYVITPEGEKVDLNIYRTEGDDGKWKDITKEEYEELLSRRIDKLHLKIASHLLWTLLSNSCTEEEEDRRDKAYRELDQSTRKAFEDRLDELCTFFENPDHYQYNTFSMCQALCRNEIEKFKDIPELVQIADHLKSILETIKE